MKIDINGTEHDIKFTFEAIEKIEAEIGTSFLSIMAGVQFDANNVPQNLPKVAHMRAIIAGGCGISKKAVETYADELGAIWLIETFVMCLAALMEGQPRQKK